MTTQTPPPESSVVTQARSLIKNPRAVPILQPSLEGPKLRDDQLNSPWLRWRFSQDWPWEAELVGDRPGLSRPDLRPASVLIALIERHAGITVLLTQRTEHLADHAGQVSFPGGRAEPEDADAIATALREAQEEVGLPAESLEVIGSLPEYITITGYRVTPVVALARPPFELVADPQEVETAFEVPLAFICDPSNHQRRGLETPGASRSFYAMPYRSADHDHREFFIWGATAAMLRNLYHYLTADLAVSAARDWR